MSSQPSERTLICTVVFADLVGHTLRTVEDQRGLKDCFTITVAQAVSEIPEAERIIVDSGDGAAIAFPVEPENALFVALELRRVFAERLRVGINLGPLQVVKDVNGHQGVVGDAINAANRVMGFAQPGQIVASRSFKDALAFLAPEYGRLFAFGGRHMDKHVREHEVYVAGDVPEAYERARASLARRAQSSPAKTFRAVIAEDEPVLRCELVDLLARVWPELKIAAIAADGLAAVRAVEETKPDILFLDIQMPGMTGMRGARRPRRPSPRGAGRRPRAEALLPRRDVRRRERVSRVPRAQRAARGRPLDLRGPALLTTRRGYWPPRPPSSTSRSRS